MLFEIIVAVCVIANVGFMLLYDALSYDGKVDAYCKDAERYVRDVDTFCEKSGKLVWRVRI